MADSGNNNDYAPALSFPSSGEWGLMMEMGKILVETGFMPKAIDTPAKAAAVMLKGRELGVPPMEALSNIVIIGGKPVVQAKLLMALVKRAYGPDSIWVEATSDQAAKVGYVRAGKIRFYTFSMADAERAGLTNPDKWGNPSMYHKYPGPMLRARCISAVCTMEFPDVTGGLYVPGELGDPVQVDPASGDVITVEVSQPSRPVERQPEKPAQAPRAVEQGKPAEPVVSDRQANVDPGTGEILDDRSAPKPAAKPAQAAAQEYANPIAATAAQRGRIQRLAGAQNITPSALDELSKKHAGVGFEDLNKRQASGMIDLLEARSAQPAGGK